MGFDQVDEQENRFENPYENPENYSGFVIVRLSEEYIDLESETLREAAAMADLEDLVNVLKNYDYPSQRLISSKDPRKILEMEERAKDSPFPPLFSLVQSWRLDVREEQETIPAIIDELHGVKGVAWVYPELFVGNPDIVDGTDDSDFPMQRYLQAAEVGGIDAVFAWDFPNGSGTGIQIADIELGWDLDNVEFLTKKPKLRDGFNHPGYSHHGTAVLGILIADDNDVGGLGVAPMKGVSPQMEKVHVFSHFREFDNSQGHIACAITSAIDILNPGDILLIEAELSPPTGGGGDPAEYSADNWAAIRLASAHDIIVVEAAGNKGVNLDNFDPLWISFSEVVQPFNNNHPNFPSWDSGAILVAGADWHELEQIFTRSRYGFEGSNFGSRVDCFSWGNGVVTIGYNDLAAGAPRFSGTSAAAPIIAGAAALLQSIYRHVNSGQSLLPSEMRAILSDPVTGTEQDSNELALSPIGIMPDLKAILTSDSRFH